MTAVTERGEVGVSTNGGCTAGAGRAGPDIPEVRALLGFDGSRAMPPGRRWGPEGSIAIVVLTGLAAALCEAIAVLVVLSATDIGSSSGLPASTVRGYGGSPAIFVALVAVPTVWFVGRVRSWTLVVQVGAAISAGILALFGAGAAAVHPVLLALAGVALAFVWVVHPVLLTVSYPPSSRGRAIGLHAALVHAGRLVAVLALVAMTGMAGFTWRATFVVLGLGGAVVAFAALRLRDPDERRFEVRPIQRLLRGQDADADGDDDADRTPGEGATPADPGLRIGEAMNRVVAVPSLRLLFAAGAALGMVAFPLPVALVQFLRAEWHSSPGAEILLIGIVAAVSTAALVATGLVCDVLLRRDPARLATVATVVVADAVLVLVLGVHAPYAGLAFTLVTLGAAGIACGLPVVTLLVQVTAPVTMRLHAAALQAVFVFGVGSFAGSLLFGSVDRRGGSVAAVTALLFPGAVVVGALWRLRTTLAPDIESAVDAVVESEELRLVRQRGEHVPLLSCRGLDFHYGRMQVLFDVDFEIDEGGMVALLGTNGAGKSTLLRAIAGLGFPRNGSVRLDGDDITHADATRRVRMGISTIEGGHATFGPLSVVDNLRVHGYAHGRNKGAVDEGIEATFREFRLAERRNQLASTLSGGEQQMLALGKALIMKPRILLIDELSLGLAPIIVNDLLTMVRRINDDGTAVVLVEQSVTTALSLVDHAYFMEKGEIRFSGPAKELVGRDDLLRSVFLEGASKGMTS